MNISNTLYYICIQRWDWSGPVTFVVEVHEVSSLAAQRQEEADALGSSGQHIQILCISNVGSLDTRTAAAADKLTLTRY